MNDTEFESIKHVSTSHRLVVQKHTNSYFENNAYMMMQFAIKITIPIALTIKSLICQPKFYKLHPLI